MKKSVLALVLTASIFTGSMAVVAAPQSGATSWVSINQNLDVIAQKVKKLFPFLTALNMDFDPKVSDLSGDRVSVSLSAATDQAAWGNKNAALAIGAMGNAKDVVDGQRKLQGALTAELKTETVLALKHLLKHNDCESTSVPTEQSPSALRREYACKFMVRLQQAVSIDDLRLAIVNTMDEYTQFLPLYVTAIKELLKSEKDPQKIQQYEYFIRTAEYDLKQFSAVKITADAKLITIEVALSQPFGKGSDATLKFDISQNSTSVVLHLTSFMVDEQDYQEYKNFVAEFLTRIEQNEAQMIEYITDLISGYAEFIGETITK